MAGDEPAPFRLDDEQRARIRDCLRKDKVSLTPDRFERFVGEIEKSTDHFLGLPLKETFRDAHDALRDLWALAHEDDPPIGQIRVRLTKLPLAGREYVGRRARNVMRRLGVDLGGPAAESSERAFDHFLQWTKTAEALKRPKAPMPLPKTVDEHVAALSVTAPASPPILIRALRVLSSDGGRNVGGRSRGAGKRSRLRFEPVIMGEARGAGTVRHRGGRPTIEYHQTLVMHLALDWLTATGGPPKSGRSDSTGFGDLVHTVFLWLGLSDEKAAYALRRYWADVKALKAHEPLEDFLRRDREEL